MPEPLTDDRLAEIAETHPGGWYHGEWRSEYVKGTPDTVGHYVVKHVESDTVLAALPDWAGGIALFLADSHEAVPDLLVEVDRVRAEVAELRTQLATSERQASELDAELQACKQRIHDAAMTKVWRNEDGKKFVFVEDLVGPLLGREVSS
jgi:hypothetical protein